MEAQYFTEVSDLTKEPVIGTRMLMEHSDSSETIKF